MLLLLVFFLTDAATATITITTTTTAAAAAAVAATRTRKRVEAIFSGNGHDDDDDHDEADGVVQTKLYSFRLDCSIVSFTAANTNLIFSVSVAHVKCE